MNTSTLNKRVIFSESETPDGEGYISGEAWVVTAKHIVKELRAQYGEDFV